MRECPRMLRIFGIRLFSAILRESTCAQFRLKSQFSLLLGQFMRVGQRMPTNIRYSHIFRELTYSAFIFILLSVFLKFLKFSQNFSKLFKLSLIFLKLLHNRLTPTPNFFKFFLNPIKSKLTFKILRHLPKYYLPYLSQYYRYLLLFLSIKISSVPVS